MQKRPLAWPPPPESAASLGVSLADQSHVHGPGPGLPGQRKLLPNPRARLLGYGPPPTWGCTEDTAVSSTLNTPLWPSTQRMPGSATCGRDTPGGHWPALPHTAQATSLSHCDTGLTVALPGGTAGHLAPWPRSPAQRWGRTVGSANGGPLGRRRDAQDAHRRRETEDGWSWRD